jgi:hypothetical protein
MIRFNPKLHKYTDEQDREYISVTTLLSKEFPFNPYEVAQRCVLNENSKYYKCNVSEVLQEWRDSSAYGNKVHNAVEKYIKSKSIPTDISLKHCVDQFKKLNWRGSLLSEQKIYHEEYLVAGTADLIEDMGDYFWLWDIKTSTNVGSDKLKKFSMQLEIYKRLIEHLYKKECKLGGIIWFEEYVRDKDKTKLNILKPIECKKAVDVILNKRKQFVSL